jgi:hypothetical protein
VRTVYELDILCQAKLYGFLESDCTDLDVKDEEEEQSLETYAVYKRYCSLFEGEFTAFMEKIGVGSMEEMQEKLSS